MSWIVHAILAGLAVGLGWAWWNWITEPSRPEDEPDYLGWGR